MSATAWLAAGAGALAAVLLGALVRIRGRLALLEARTARLEGCIDEELSPALREVRGEARAAGATARRAAAAAGLGEPPRRLPLESVTGPVVRAVAFGAGVRRTLARLAGTRGSRRRTDRAA